MVGCTIPFCNNSSEKQYTMKILPRDTQRQEQWIKSVNKKYKWTPSKHSYLCEVHFEPEMWEQRMDNKKKLKQNAVPTIFGFFLKKKHSFHDNQTFDVLEQNRPVHKEDQMIVNDTQMVINETIEPSPSTSLINNTALALDKSTIDGKEKNDKKIETRNKTLQLHLMVLRKKNKILKSRVQTLEDKIKNDKFKKALEEMFNEDQIKALCTKHRRIRNWCNETIQRALRLRLTCGKNGYEELLQQRMPLPSLRTLQRRLENLKFGSGISNDMFEFLKLKVSSFQNDIDKEYGLVIDEMSITPKHVYDSSTKTLLGDITLPHEEGIATHALTLMLTGTASRWKHIVGYFYTGDSFNGETVKDILFQIINKAEQIGLHVNYITSDMGPGNGKIWKCCGINVGRYSEVKNYISHPSNPGRFLYFIADVPHLLKNLKEALVTNKVLFLPQEVVIKYKLPSDRVEIAHFYELIESQTNLEFLLTPKLYQDDIKCTNNYNKMRVNKAKNVFSTHVSSSLHFLANENHKPEFYTTAWFVEQISKWFSLMTSRSCCTALGTKNADIYNASISFLYEIIDLFKNIKIGHKAIFKPVQRGIILSTTSVINLVQYLLNHCKFQFVLTGRLTQDCIENLFSQLRHKNVVLDSLQFKNNLKLIAITMFTKPILTGNYDTDDSEYLSGFLDYLKSKNDNVLHSSVFDASSTIIDQIPPFDNSVIMKYNNIEMNCLYNLAGYCLASVKKTCITCSTCVQSVASKTPQNFQFSELVKIKCYKANTLYFINKQTFQVFLQLENIYRHYCPYFKNMRNENLHQFLINKFDVVPTHHIPDCHNLRLKLFKKFATVRLKLKNKRRIVLPNRKYYDSKSMAMHNSFK